LFLALLFFLLFLERSFLALFLGGGCLLQEQRLQAGIGRRRDGWAYRALAQWAATTVACLDLI
jgi:hypothetical protein